MIKSFRNKINTGDQHTIRLSTKDGLIGYKIKKFEVINFQPGTEHTETVMKIYAQKRDTVDVDIDFSDPNLLAVVYYEDSATAGSPGKDAVIFDNVAINQDIYITYKDNSNETVANYYVELEQMKLDLNEATVATLKDMRGRE